MTCAQRVVVIRGWKERDGGVPERAVAPGRNFLAPFAIADLAVSYPTPHALKCTSTPVPYDACARPSSLVSPAMQGQAKMGFALGIQFTDAEPYSPLLAQIKHQINRQGQKHEKHLFILDDCAHSCSFGVCKAGLIVHVVYSHIRTLLNKVLHDLSTRRRVRLL